MVHPQSHSSREWWANNIEETRCKGKTRRHGHGQHPRLQSKITQRWKWPQTNFGLAKIDWKRLFTHPLVVAFLNFSSFAACWSCYPTARYLLIRTRFFKSIIDYIHLHLRIMKVFIVCKEVQQLGQGRIDQQLHNSDLTALGLSLASLMICIPCFRLQDRQSIWRKFPFRMLVWYVGACMFHALSGVLVNTLLPVCSRVGAYLISYCEIQRYVLVALMLHWLHRFEAGVRADKTIWIALVAPIPICACTPQPVTKKYCVLQGGEANRFYVLAGIVSFLILACLTLAGLLRSKRAEAESPRTPERSPQPAPSFLVANSLVEFEPDSPTCYQHLGSSRSPTRLPIRASRQMTPPLSRRTLEMEEIENASSEFASAINGTLLEDRFLDSGASQLTALANLKFAILVIASKCTVVLAISLVVRSILFFQPFHTETESALVFGLMVELLLENTEGIFVLLITLALFETQWSRLTRLVRMRHRQARSQVHSTERFPEELREGDGSMHLQ